MSDHELETQFRALRDEEAASSPSYARVLANERPASRPAERTTWWRVALPVLAMLVAAIWFASPRPNTVEPAAPESFEPVRWAMPTDVLLKMPGSDLLREVPNLEIESLLFDPELGSNSNRGTRG